MIRSNEIGSCSSFVEFPAIWPGMRRRGAAGAGLPRTAARSLELSAGLELSEEWGLLLPGAPEPRLTLLRRQGFRSVFQTALRGLSNRSIVVVCNYGLAR